MDEVVCYDYEAVMINAYMRLLIDASVDIRRRCFLPFFSVVTWYFRPEAPFTVLSMRPVSGIGGLIVL